MKKLIIFIKHPVFWIRSENSIYKKRKENTDKNLEFTSGKF